MSQWNCPHCHGPIGPVPDLAEQTVACPYCLAPITVPGSINAARRSRRLKWLLVGSMLMGLSASAAIAFLVLGWPDKLLDRQVVIQLASHTEQDDSTTVTTEFAAYSEPISAVEIDGYPEKASPTECEECPVQLCAGEDADHPRQSPVAETESTAVALSSFTPRMNTLSRSDRRQILKPSTAQADASLDLTCPVDQATCGSQEQSPEQENVIVASQETSELATESVSSPFQRGLGVSRDEVIYGVQEYFDVEFYNQPVRGSADEEVSAEVEGVEVTLWGDVLEVKSVTVSGRFDSDGMALLLATIISRVMPSWPIDAAGDWFTKAVNRCDEETFVSTLKDEVELTLMTAGVPGEYWVFFQPDRG